MDALDEFTSFALHGHLTLLQLRQLTGRQSAGPQHFQAIKFGKNSDHWQWLLPKDASGVGVSYELSKPPASSICPLCTKNYDDAEHRPVEVVGNVSCRGHVFGKRCIEVYLHSNHECPSCKQALHQDGLRPRPEVHPSFGGMDIEAIRREWQEVCSLEDFPKELDCIWFDMDTLKLAAVGDSRTGVLVDLES